MGSSAAQDINQTSSKDYHKMRSIHEGEFLWGMPGGRLEGRNGSVKAGTSKQPNISVVGDQERQKRALLPCRPSLN